MSFGLADELFLMSHDLQTGKALAGEPALGTGLAAGLLAELIVGGALSVHEGLVGLGPYGPPADQLSQLLWEETRGRVSAGLTVSDWLANRIGDAHDLVAERLVRAGDLRRETVRRLGRTSVRLLPLRPADAFIRSQRVPSYLRNRVEVTEADVVVARLAQLVAPHGLELDDVGRDYLQQLLPALQGPLREVLAAVESRHGRRGGGH